MNDSEKGPLLSDERLKEIQDHTWEPTPHAVVKEMAAELLVRREAEKRDAEAWAEMAANSITLTPPDDDATLSPIDGGPQ